MAHTLSPHERPRHGLRSPDLPASRCDRITMPRWRSPTSSKRAATSWSPPRWTRIEARVPAYRDADPALLADVRAPRRRAPRADLRRSCGATRRRRRARARVRRPPRRAARAPGDPAGRLHGGVPRLQRGAVGRARRRQRGARRGPRGQPLHRPRGDHGERRLPRVRAAAARRAATASGATCSRTCWRARRPRSAASLARGARLRPGRRHALPAVAALPVTRRRTSATCTPPPPRSAKAAGGERRRSPVVRHGEIVRRARGRRDTSGPRSPSGCGA